MTEYLHQTSRYHRGHLHAALAKHVPSEIIQLRKQIIHVDADASQGVTLKFKDGSTATADVLLGADGLHSVGFLVISPSSEADMCTGSETVVCA